jgi:hypothetical protein
MPDYALFGGVLRSELTFPQFRPITATTPTWTLQIRRERTPLGDAELLGDFDAVVRRLQIYRRGAGYRVQYSDVLGYFDISASGAEIIWCPDGEADAELIELARFAVIGRILPMALHSSGVLCLHASAVVVGEQAIAFLAPSTYGKSTLAMACARSGGRLLADDALPIFPDPPVTAGPGVHSVRLRDDSAERFGGDEISDVRGRGGKLVVELLPGEQVALDRVPLGALYLLQPVAAMTDGSAVHRRPTPPIPAALSVVSHLKLGAELGKADSAVNFDRAVRVTRSVPVYTLSVVRDLDRLGEVVAQLTRWHSESSTLCANAASA